MLERSYDLVIDLLESSMLLFISACKSLLNSSEYVSGQTTHHRKLCNKDLYTVFVRNNLIIPLVV